MANGHCSSGGVAVAQGSGGSSGGANSGEDSETKPLLVVKKVEESGSITAILSRQLQGRHILLELVLDEALKSPKIFFMAKQRC